MNRTTRLFLCAAAAFLALSGTALASDGSTRGAKSRTDSLDVQTVTDSTVMQTAPAKPRKRTKGVWDRKKFMNLSYSLQTLAPNYGNECQGRVAAAIVNGRSIYLHKKPIAGMLKFSIDFGSDINYAQYLPLEGDYNLDSEVSDMLGFSGRHHLDVGLFIGPAVSVNPVGKLVITGYFRFVPSYSVVMMDTDIYHGFTPYFTYGGEIAWNWVGLGIEGRSGSGSYSSLTSLIGGGTSMPSGYSTQALRMYLCFRF